MLYWVIYDISENGKRSKVASKCKNYGFFRVQKSAFIGNTTRNRVEMLGEEIREIVHGTQNCVFIMPACKDCFGGKIIEGHLDEERLKHRDFVFFSGGNHG